MLAGIGGRTIEEAKARLSMSEARNWARYRGEKGELFLGTRLERALSFSSFFLARMAGNKDVRRPDFLTYEEYEGQKNAMFEAFRKFAEG